jgi:hypothetical protein
MRFVLGADLDTGALAGEDRAEELGRILRYWGGNVKKIELGPGSRRELYDSGCTAVGDWRVGDWRVEEG